MTQTFKTSRDAAIAGLQVAIERAKETGWEWGGMVFKNEDGTFSPSHVVTNEDPHSVQPAQALPKDLSDRLDDVDARIKAQHGDDDEELEQLSGQLDKEIDAKVEGIFHTHLTHLFPYDLTRYFSGRDVYLTTKLKHKSWLGLTDTGEVFELDGATFETLDATKGDVQFNPNRKGLPMILHLMMTDMDSSFPFAVTGIQVYAGNAAQAERKAA